MIASSLLRNLIMLLPVLLSMRAMEIYIKELPVMSQISCINAILPIDVNTDGYIDLVTGGNQFGFLPQFEKLDGSLVMF